MDKIKPSDYWTSTHVGYTFEESDIAQGTASSTILGNNEDYLSLKYNGLIEASENAEFSGEFSSEPVVWEDYDEEKILSTYNPLELKFKKEKREITNIATQTIKCMIFGQNYSLEPFKGKDSKTELLKAAVLSHDGNAILTVVLFLRRTLKKSIFQREVRLYPDAVNLYLNHLEDNNETDELTNMFLLLDIPEEAAMIKYCSALSLQNPDRKIKSIDNCLSTHFQSAFVDKFLSASVIEHKQLLRHQVAVEELYLAANSFETNEFQCYQLLTNETKLVDTSVMCSLVFCCLIYYGAAEAYFTSPLYTKNSFNLSKKQFTWGAIRALSAMKRWSEMDDLFVSKNWMGNSKIKPSISISQLLSLLETMEAPKEILFKYIQSIENQEMKLLSAKKYKYHSLVIEILKMNKDKRGLIDYKNTLPLNSVHFCSATDVLNTKGIKWRN